MADSSFPFIPGVTESDTDNLPPFDRLVRAIAIDEKSAQVDISEGVDKLKNARRKVEEPELRSRLQRAISLLLDGEPNESRSDDE